MAPQSNERLRQMQLAYIGKLMANLSHEFKNHLAIIKETCGLLEDLLMIAEAPGSHNNDRYEKIFSTVTERIALASEMCRHLSGFSHRMDQPLSSFSVSDLLVEETYLLERLARQKQVEVNLTSTTALPAIFNDPCLLQFACFCIIWPALESMGAGSRIGITAREAGEGGTIEIVFTLEGISKVAETGSNWQKLLPEILQLLHARHTVTSPRQGVEDVVITIPSLETPA